MEHESWQIERRTDGAVVVRVPSSQRQDEGLPDADLPDADLPDAVFAFRLGDPQYSYWQQKLEEQDKGL